MCYFGTYVCSYVCALQGCQQPLLLPASLRDQSRLCVVASHWGLVASQFGPEGTCELLTSGSGGHLLAAGDIHSVLDTLEVLVPCVKVGVSEHLWT